MAEPNNIIGDRFEILEQIGQGGMATVYRGRDLRDGGIVAIKRLQQRAIALAPDIVERFEREGEALRRLNHPNIVKMLATVKADNSHYVVMEYVGGGDLHDLLDSYRQRGGTIPIDQVLDMALDLSDALTRAHRLKIIHRDIKPANVLIAEDSTPRLTDFGVARFQDVTRVTGTGAVIGTAGYLSPEACMGEQIDERADIWSFGVMLYEMLTLQRPFEEDSITAMVYAIMSKDYTPLEELRSDVPPALVALVNQMLVKDVQARIGSVRLVGAQLEAIIQGKDLPQSIGELSPLTPTSTEVVHTTTRTDSNTRARGLQTSTTSARTQNIYISYRPSDSGVEVGRLYDRLMAAFGAKSIVRDVLKSDSDSSTQETLNRRIRDCHIMLIVIGPAWLTETDETGTSRLFGSKDRVRQEIETGLRQDGLLIVPLLVQGASMPASHDLPSSIRGLTRFDAMPITDNDFDADVKYLIEQIRNTVAAARRPASGRMLLGAVIMAVAVLATILILLNRPRLANQRESPDRDNAAQTNGELIRVNPVGEREYMILVAEMEHLGGTERDVSRFIVQDLQRVFEQTSPYSKLRIRAYPQVIISNAQAVAAAEANQAAMVIWGNYDDNGINIELQVGSLEPFPGNPFTRQNLEAIANAQVRMTNERAQSLTASVVAIMNILQTANNDTFNIPVNLTTQAIAAPVNADVVGNSAAARWHRYMGLYHIDREAALREVSAAIELNPHPIFYMGRSLTEQQLRMPDAAEQDIHTSLNTGPEGWPMALINLSVHYIFIENDLTRGIDYANQYVAALPDDWYGYAIRGGAAYFAGDYNLAREDLTRAIELDSELNMIYFAAAALALREGRLVDAQQYIRTVQQRFPDPTFVERVLDAGFALTVEDSVFASSAAAYGNLILGQWNRVIEFTELALSQPGTISDFYLLLGIAQCNLADYAAAEASYTSLLQADPGYTLAHALRLEARREQGNLRGALADGAAILASPQAQLYAPFAEAMRDGEINCTNMLTADLSQYISEVTSEPSG